MNYKILIGAVIVALLLIGIFILHKNTSGRKNPMPTIQYSAPIGPVIPTAENGYITQLPSISLLTESR